MNFLVESSIRSVLAAVAVAAVLRALRITSARARHMAWCAVLASMLLLPAFCAWAPKAAIRVLPAHAESAPIDWSPVAGNSPDPVSMPQGRPRPSVAPAASSPSPVWMFYVLVTGLFLVRLAAGAARANAIRRRARPENGFLSSSECACPITIGWWKPVIVLPASWPEWPSRELDAVFAHERRHVRRRDPLVQGLASLNRCLFWFHPLAWWLERRLAALAEEACDSAVIASGHDPREYAGYLIRHARAVERAGARIALSGAAMSGGVLAKRIRRLIDETQPPEVSRLRAIFAAALCAFAIGGFTACQLSQKAAPGQPTMHELFMRRAQSNLEYEKRSKTILDRAHTMTARDVEELVAQVKQKPDDKDGFSTLQQYYQFHGDVKGLDSLKLWYIEHDAGAKVWANIDPHLDPAAYAKGKALWLANLKQPGASADLYQRAADFLEAGDKPLAGSVLEAGRKAYPADPRWPIAFGQHYAEVLAGSAEPLTEYNVIRKTSAQEAQSAYARKVQAELDSSRDAQVLAHTAGWLSAWGGPSAPGGSAATQLAHRYVDRALAIDSNLSSARGVAARLKDEEKFARLRQLRSMPPAELAAVPAADRMLLLSFQMRETATKQDFARADSQAHELLALAAENPNVPLDGEAVFAADMIMGKAALHRGDRKAAARFLLKAADAPASEWIRRGEFEMNLPRALVDYGERRAVIDFFRRMAPRTTRTQQFQQWADQLSKGINPDLFPTFSAPGCKHDPC